MVDRPGVAIGMAHPFQAILPCGEDLDNERIRVKRQKRFTALCLPRNRALLSPMTGSPSGVTASEIRTAELDTLSRPLPLYRDCCMRCKADERLL